ncbi:LCP family protein [Arthrobacter halodurans]|uniref:LCP family protein n=1 Tax=Arthrobacter halodurans TaxID=516699 RepID=A0ABV4ULY5_9MICC
MPRPDTATTYVPRRQTAPKRRWARTALIAGLCVVLVAAVVAGGYIANLAALYNDRSTTIAGVFPADEGRPAKPVDDGSRNILLLGSDSRGEGLDTAENKGESGERSDTMMLVHIPEDRQNIYVMSIVRDLWVEIPGHGERKINAALNLGGYPLVVGTVEQLLDTQIDNVVSIDFEGFGALTESLGGVTVDNPVAFCSGQAAPSCFDVGPVNLNGTAALRYVRERKAFAEGDFQRVQNQQRFVKAVLNRFLTPETLGNPARLQQVIADFSQYVSVDETLDAGTAAGLALQLSGIRGDDVEMFTLPTGPAGTGPGGASIITRDEEALRALRLALKDDSLRDFLANEDHGSNAFGGSITDDEAAGEPADESTAGESTTDPGAAPAVSPRGAGE